MNLTSDCCAQLLLYATFWHLESSGNNQQASSKHMAQVGFSVRHPARLGRMHRHYPSSLVLILPSMLHHRPCLTACPAAKAAPIARHHSCHHSKDAGELQVLAELVSNQASQGIFLEPWQGAVNCGASGIPRCQYCSRFWSHAVMWSMTICLAY